MTTLALPSVQIDAVFEAEADGPLAIVANRDPFPGETQVPLRQFIGFDHITFVGAAPLQSDFDITINGELAIGSGQSLLAQWHGSFELAGPGVMRVVIIPLILGHAQGSRVHVNVSVAGAFVSAWWFVAKDLTAPLIESVAAVNKDQVLVTFTEPVGAGAVDPANYVIERVSRPAATPAVSTAARVSEIEVLLTTQFELTFGAHYMLVVSDVADEFDNVITPPDNVANFDGFMPPYPAGRRFLLHDFVPATTLAQDSSRDLMLFLGCLQDGVNLQLHMIDRWSEILDPDDAPESFIDAMLVDLGNPFDFELDVVDKRKLAKLLVRIYQLKGTERGIIDVVRFFLGIEVTIEVFNGLGWKLGVDKLSSSATVAAPNPAIVGAGVRASFSFRVRTAQILTSVARGRIFEITNYMKGAQEHLVGIVDAKPLPAAYRYWKLGFTRTGYTKIARL